jgi:hypothetical protein
MKYNILFFISFMCCGALASAENTTNYYGKTLPELMREDRELAAVVGKARSTIRWYTYLSWFTAPSLAEKQDMQVHINFFQEKVQTVDECLREARRKIEGLTGSRGSMLPDNNPGIFLAGLLVFGPFLLLASAAERHAVAQIQREIATMEKTRAELWKLGAGLQSVMTLE